MSATRSGSGTDGYSAETWTYLGIRAGAKGRRSHAWQEPSGRVWLYNDTGSYVTGGLYAVKVDRTSERLTRTAPEYTGQISPDVDLGELETLSKAARAKLARLARERRDGAQKHRLALPRGTQADSGAHAGRRQGGRRAGPTIRRHAGPRRRQASRGMAGTGRSHIRRCRAGI